MDKLVRRLLIALGLLMLAGSVWYHMSVWRPNAENAELYGIYTRYHIAMQSSTETAVRKAYLAVERARWVATTAATAGLGLIVAAWWLPPLSSKAMARWRRFDFDTSDTGGT